jgi:hypothetical protein
MCTASKSPRTVAAVAMAVGNRTLPQYGHRFSRHDFTLAQLFACLVLRRFFGTDYRGIIAILDDCRELRRVLGLRRKTPHFTTLQKAEQRLLSDRRIKRFLSYAVAMFHACGSPVIDAHGTAHLVPLAAADSTGFSLDHASRYFITRRTRAPAVGRTAKYRRFAKLAVIVDCESHLILATHRGMGPRPDVDELRPLLSGMCSNVLPERLVADGGYDSQYNHRLLREQYGVESIIPALLGRPTTALPTDRWRWLMAVALDEEAYGQRWQVETVMSMLKRHQGAALRSRSYQARRREMGLAAVTHNIMIVRPPPPFLQSILIPFFPSYSSPFRSHPLFAPSVRLHHHHDRGDPPRSSCPAVPEDRVCLHRHRRSDRRDIPPVAARTAPRR